MLVGPCTVVHVEMEGGLFQVEVRGVECDRMPYVGQLVLPSVPVEGWIIDPYVHSLLDGPYKGYVTSYTQWRNCLI